MNRTPTEQPSGPSVNLKDPALAAFLAWLIPGLGHLYQGRIGKAALFFVCIMGTFVFGLYLGSNREVGWGRVVYASWRAGDRRLPYLCQIGVGLPAMPAIVQAIRVRNGKDPFPKYFMAPPQLQPGTGQPTVNMLHYQLARYFDLGTVYTMVAGLLNILVIYDAWGGPVFAEEKEEEEDEQQDDEQPG